MKASLTVRRHATILREYLGLIRSEAFRCKSITMGLLDFSRTRTSQHVTIDLADVIRSAARLLSHQKRSPELKFNLDIAPDLSPVSGDPGQLQQAIIALATNAIDAMGESGTLSILAADANGKVVVEVSDTGVGIPRKTCRKSSSLSLRPRKLGKELVSALRYVMVS